MTDAEVVKNVRQAAAELEAYNAEKTSAETFILCAYGILGLAFELNAANIDMTLKDMTLKGEPVGDWVVSARRISNLDDDED